MSMTFVYEDVGPSIKRVRINWTSDAGGAAAGTLKKITGRLLKGVTKPTDGPTDNYDITLTDEQGVDVLGNCDSSLMNRDTANAEESNFLLKNSTPAGVGAFPSVCNVLSVAVANAGNAKSGLCVLYIDGFFE
jgi:hypothetical protein